MGREYVILSFFKERQIDYRFDSLEKIVIFPCFFCHNEATLDTYNSRWNCEECDRKGSLVDLIKFTKNKNVTTKLFNYEKEIKKTYTILAKLKRNSKDIITINSIEEQLDRIFDNINKKFELYSKKNERKNL